MRRVRLDRLSNGERIACVSAILLLVFMFFHWFGVKATNTSNLLFAVRAGGPGKSAWDALEYIPIILLITIIVTLAVAALRLTNAVRKSTVSVNAMVAVLGLISVALICFRLLNPPIFDTETTITFEGTIQLPIFLALFAAAGITVGGCMALREGGFPPLSDLRPHRSREQGSRHGQVHRSGESS